MKLAIHNPSFTYPGGPENIAPMLAATARAAEEGGADQFTLMDHWFQIPPIGAHTEPMLEALHRARLRRRADRADARSACWSPASPTATPACWRRPSPRSTSSPAVAPSSASAPPGSSAEHDGLGVPFPPIAERFERLEEAIQICFQMWSDDNGPYEGKHYQLAETLCVPQPCNSRARRILIGGCGEKKTLRLVAKYADACNLFGGEPDVVAHKLEVLKGHCEAEGRDYDEIEKTIIYNVVNPAKDADKFLAAMEEMDKLGIQKVWVSNNKVGDDPATWAAEVCAQTVTRLAELG